MIRADSLDAVLLRMDQAAQQFRSLSANLRKTEYTDALSDTSVEEGTLKMAKYGKDKVVLLAEFTGRDAHIVHLSGSQLEVYHPKAKSVEVYDTRKFTKSVDQYLFVGFGQTKAELQKTYTITLGGPETLAGVKTTRIDLSPKSAEAKKLFNKIELWIPDGQSNPIQEKILSGKENQDYKLFQFSNSKIRTASDPALPPSELELHLTTDVKRQIIN